DPLGYLRRADAENIHLMGHSMGGGAVLRAITVWPEAFRAAVLYGSMSGDELKNFQQIQVWTNGRGGAFELGAPLSVLEAVSPMSYLDTLPVPVSVQHSNEDATVPVAWSQELCAALEGAGRTVECFFYDGVPHTFLGYADTLFMERMIAFFDRY